jgi:hypothetical protein
MVSPIQFPDWQAFAQVFARKGMSFASGRIMDQHSSQVGTAIVSYRKLIRAYQDCTPFPSDWSDPDRVGPFFADRRLTAEGMALSAKDHVFRFSGVVIAINCELLRNQKRGSIKCAFPPFLSLPLPVCPLQPARPVIPTRVARRATVAAQRWVPSRAPSLRTCSTRTQSPVQPLARPLVHLPMMQGSATDLTAAFGQRLTFHQGPSGHFARVAFLHCRPGPGGSEGEPCSRRS